MIYLRIKPFIVISHHEKGYLWLLLAQRELVKWKWSCSVMSDSLWPVDSSPPSSSVHGILQANLLEWVAISFSRGSSRSRDQIQFSHIAGRCFNLCTKLRSDIAKIQNISITTQRSFRLPFYSQTHLLHTSPPP